MNSLNSHSTMAFQSSLPLTISRTSARSLSVSTRPAPRPTRALTVASATIPPLRRRRVQKHVDTTDVPMLPADVQIESAVVELPTGTIPGLDDLDISRGANAAVIARSKLLTDRFLSDADVVVFAHGFSQRPANYGTLLRHVASLGYIVLAPRTWLFDIVLPWQRVETTGLFAPLPDKLQTAVLIDVARCVYLAQTNGARRVQLVGHSMGAAMLLAYMPYAPTAYIGSIAMLAPAVTASSQTQLNPYVYADGDNFSSLKQLATLSPAVNMLFVQGTDDRVVPESDTAQVAQAFGDVRKALIGQANLEGGSHIGYEDQLSVDVPFIQILDRVLFFIVDLLVIGKNVLGVYPEGQLETTNKLLTAWLSTAPVQSEADIVKALEKLSTEEIVTFTWALSNIVSSSSIS